MKKIEIFNNYLANHTKGKTALSLGCAGYSVSGSIGKQYLFLEKIAKKLYGMDNDAVFVEKFSTGKNKRDIFYGDLNKFDWFDALPSKKGIELIIMTEVLEHLENPVAVLKYIKANKPKKCKLLISVPNGGSIGRLIHGALGTKVFTFQDREHLCLFNEVTIMNCCKLANLKVLDAVPYVWNKNMRFLAVFPSWASGFFVLCE